MSILLTDIDPIVAYTSINIHCTCEKTMSPSSHKLPVQRGSTSHSKIQINIKFFTDILLVAVKANQEGLKLSGSHNISFGFILMRLFIAWKYNAIKIGRSIIGSY